MKTLIALITSLLLSPYCLGVVVIQYHHVDDNTPNATSISPTLFDQHLTYLAENNFHAMSGKEFVKFALNERAKTDLNKQVLITFDDGYASIKDHAHSILHRYNFPYVIFINPTLIGTKGYLSLEELKALEQNGATIANHTQTHPHLIRVKPFETQQQWLLSVEQEILKTQEFIEEHFTSRVKLFAYPYGEFNAQLKALLDDHQFLGFSQHSGAIGMNTDLQALPRFAFGGNYGSIEDFQIKVNSLPLPISGIKIESENGELLSDPLLPNGISKPNVFVHLDYPSDTQKAEHLKVNCFATGAGAIPVDKPNSSSFTTQTKKSLPIGRSRYNCTAKSLYEGRYYWLSLPFYRKNLDGSWYSEY